MINISLQENKIAQTEFKLRIWRVNFLQKNTAEG
jgi:hypothetical protein